MEETGVIQCCDCPAKGYSYRDGKEIQDLCCCAGHETTRVKDRSRCQYGITNYRDYWKKLLKDSGMTDNSVIVVHFCET